MKSTVDFFNPRSRLSASKEMGFSLVELVVVVLILGILAAVTVPLFFASQQNSQKDTIRVDVKSTVQSIKNALFSSPTADEIKGFNPGATVVQPSDGVAVTVTRTSPTTTVRITAAVNDGSSAAIANGTASWSSYEVTATDSRLPNWYYTYNSNTSNYSENTTNNAATNDKPSDAPNIKTTALSAATLGVAYSQKVSATGYPAPNFFSTTLPAGLSVSTDGVISGTPTVYGNYTVVISASNGAGTASKSYTLVVQQMPTFTTTTLPAAEINKAYSATVVVSAYPTATFFSSNLPTGLSIDPNTGVISGTPTKSGEFTVTITAKNSAKSVSKDFVLGVAEAPKVTTTSLASGVTGTPYSQELAASGYPAPTWTQTGLPAGLSIDVNTGKISGTPTEYGVFNVTLTATNKVSSSSKSYTLNIYAAPKINTSSLVNGKVGSAYSDGVAVTGYPTPTITATGLPAGLSISNDGTITGTPTASGLFTVQVKAVNTGGTTNKAIILEIDAPPAITTSTIANGNSDTAYSQAISATGYPTPTWDATGLPAGLTIDSATGVITGTPTASGVFTIQVTATNSLNSAAKSYTMSVLAAPEITTTSLPYATVGSSYSKTIATRGYPAPAFTSTGLPDGLSIDATSGTISGTPTTSGTFNVTVTATNSKGATQQRYDLLVTQQIAITTTTLTDGARVNRVYGTTIEATGYPAASFSATGLPPGLSISPDGLINGTPTQAGTYTFTVRGANGYTSDSKNFTIAVQQAPSITTTNLKNGNKDVAYSETVSATGYPVPTFDATGLPAGLSISSDGVISGTTSATGTFAVVVTATNSAGTDQYTYSLIFGGAPTITTDTLPPASANQSYSTFIAAASYPAPTFTAVGLPDGFVMQRQTGELSGTPLNGGTYNIIVTATNIYGSVDKPYTLLVTEHPVFITTTLPAATAGQSYTTTVSASGYPTPTFSADSLPTGLSISSTGVISGTPTTAGTYTVLVAAANAGATATKSYTFNVYAAPVLTTTNLDPANVNAPYSYTLAASGNPAPTFSATGLPTGLSLDAATGIISGTPTVTGTYTVNATATNALGSNSGNLTLVVRSAPAITTTTLPAANKGVAYSTTLAASGYPAATWSLSGTATGLTLSSAGVLSGTPTVSGQYNLTFTATNAAGFDSKLIILTINSVPVITSGALPNGTSGSAYSYQVAATGYPAPTYTATGLPAGLSIDAVTGVIAGTPTGTGGDYTVVVTGTNVNGSGSKTFTLSVTAAPTVTSTSLPNAATNTAYSYQVTANGNPAPTFTATGFPSTLSISSTGLISGTPTVTGTYTVGITVTNSIGTTTKNLAFVVNAAPVITSTTLADAKSGTAYSQTVTATGTPAPTFSATGLPATLSINSATGIISGTPTAPGTYTVSVTAVNSAASVSKTLTLQINDSPAITTASLPTGTVGTAYSQTVTATGTPTPTFTATGLPAGLSISSTGVISGTPTTATSYTASITVTNSVGTSSKSFGIVVYSKPSVTTPTLPNGLTGVSYSQTVVATGSPAPTFSVTTGTLPTGLSLNSSTGVVSGTPTAVGSYIFTVTATNTAGTASQGYTVVINAVPVITTATLSNGTAGTVYSTTVAATGTPTPTFSVSSGSLPTGLSLNTTTGVISGTPSAAASYGFSIQATNSVGSATQAYAVTIYQAPAITTTALATGTLNASYSQTVAATGFPAPTFAATGLPSGLSINSATGVISGTPTVSGTFTVNVTATNGGGVVTKPLSLVINGQLGTPANVRVTRIFGNQVTVAWDAVQNATSYNVVATGAANVAGDVSSNGAQFNAAIVQDITSSPIQIIAKGTGYANSNAGSSTLRMPGYSASGRDLSSCTRYDQTGSITADCGITSSDGVWTAIMQSDGNFVVYKNNVAANSIQAFWQSTTTTPNRLSVQTDGNLVLYTPSAAVIATNTSGNGAVRLVMDTSGNLVLNNSSGSGLWGTWGLGGGNSMFMYYVGSTNVATSSDSISAENNDTGTWHNYFGPSSSFVTGTYIAGSKSYRIQTSGNNPEGIIAGPDGINYTAGQRVLVNMYVYGTANETWVVGGRQGNPYNEGMGGYEFTTNGSGWQRIAVVWTVPSGGFQSAYIQIRQKTTSSGKVLFGDVVTVWTGY